MDQFRRLGLVGRSEVMPKVIHHVEGEEPERQHGLDRVEIEGREVVDSQKGVFGKEILPVNLSVIIGIYAAACWGNHSCSHCWLSSTTFKMPSALLPVGLQLIPLCF